MGQYGMDTIERNNPNGTLAMTFPPLADTAIVTTAQMQAIEARMFAAGMPVAALMEKVATRVARRLMARYPIAEFPHAGVLVGPGHNGGDALVVARELYHAGYRISLCLPLPRLKPLTADHWRYVQGLGVPAREPEALVGCDWIVDGLFGCGLTREVTGAAAAAIATVNAMAGDRAIPIASLDLPSGLHTDTGQPLGTAIRAQHTYCLGLWKRGLLTESGAPYAGTVERVDFDVPAGILAAELARHDLWRVDPSAAIARLPLQRPLTAHKYQIGHLLLVAGSRRYGGAALLAALGARASGAGMLSVAVPQALRDLVLAQVPEALVIPCPETSAGAIADLSGLDLSSYDAIACGCGLSLDGAAAIAPVLAAERPLLLDADALNLLAKVGIDKVSARSHPTVLTPHGGEFCRLFPQAVAGIPQPDRLVALRHAVASTGAVILLKGARTAIATPTNSGIQTHIVPESTPALARGGSGDVLTGMLGGLLAQRLSAAEAAIAAASWHAQTARWLAAERTTLGVDPVTLAGGLLPYLARQRECRHS